MNRTLNTIMYVVISTLFLTLATLAVFFVLLISFVLIMNAIGPNALGDYRIAFYLLFFIAAILGGLLIYNAVLKLVLKKWNIEKYLLQRKEKPRKPADPEIK